MDFYYFNKYFSAEGRLAFGVSDDDDVELDSLIGIYAVGHWPLSDQFQLYGLIGGSSVDVSYPGGGGDDSGLSYGVGAEFDMTNNWSLGVEYTSYLQDGEIEGSKFDATGLGVTLNYIF
jgi:opacity protein-like surface antigen